MEADADTRRIAFVTASYRLYLRRGIDDKGVPYEVNDPGLSDRDQDLIKSDNPLDFLNLSCFADVDLSLSKQVVEWYLKWYKRIEEKGILNTMEELLV